MNQKTVPCVVYRGGTSRGLFFHKKDLPENWEETKHIFLSGLDAYNTSQINGLGGTTTHSSKAVIMAPSERDDADADYTFAQIGVGNPVVDTGGTCGNLMAATALFALDEGLASAKPGDAVANVRIYATNIDRVLNIAVPVKDGRPSLTGDYRMPGVVQPGPKIRVSIMHPGGGMTGKTLPLGLTYQAVTPDGTYTVSVADIVNPLVFVEGSALGLSGTESFASVAADTAMIARMQKIRDAAAVALGFAKSLESAATESLNVPRLVAVAPPQDYVTSSGKAIKADDVDVLIKAHSAGKLHRTCPASALYCIAAACLLPGTVANKVARDAGGAKEKMIRIGHPDGVAEVRATLTADGGDVISVGMDRTARRIMKGELYIPEE